MKNQRSVLLVFLMGVILLIGPLFAESIEPQGKTEAQIDALGNVEGGAEEQKENDNEDLFMLSLAEEMLEVEEMILLQKRKLELLEGVRRKYMANTRQGQTNVISSAAFKQDLEESLLRIKEPATVGYSSQQPTFFAAQPSQGSYPPTLPSAAAPDPRHAGMDPGSLGHSFESYMVAKAMTNVSAPIAHVLVLNVKVRGPNPGQKPGAPKTGGARAKQAMSLVAALDIEGTLHIYSTIGELMLSYDTGHSSVATLGFDGADNEPALVTAGQDGSIHIHSLTVWRNERVIAGPRAPSKKGQRQKKQSKGQKQEEANKKENPEGERNNGTSSNNAVKTPELYTHDQLGVTMSLKAVAATPTSSAPVFTSSGQVLNATADAAIQAIVFATVRSTGKVILVADDEGHIRQYMRNGTLARVLETGQPIRALAKTGQYMSYASGPEIHFISTSRFRIMEGYSCSGTMSNITSLVSDYTNVGVVYAGTDSGDVLAMATRHKDETVCRLMQKLPARLSAPSSTKVFTIRGYLLAASGNILSVYNITDAQNLGIRWLFDHKMPGCKDEPLSFTLPFPLVNKMGEVITAMTSQCRPTEILIHEALLPYHHSEIDIRWMRLPLLGLGLIGVFGWQWYKRRSGSSGGNSGGKFGKFDQNSYMPGMAGRGGRRSAGAFDMDQDGLDDRDFGSQRRYS